MSILPPGSDINPQRRDAALTMASVTGERYRQDRLTCGRLLAYCAKYADPADIAGAAGLSFDDALELIDEAD